MNSLSGRIFVVLSVGLTAAAVLSLALAEQTRRRDFQTMRVEELVARTEQLHQRWTANDDPELRDAGVSRLLGLRLLEDLPPHRSHPRLERRLLEALGPGSRPQAGVVPLEVCMPDAEQLRRSPISPLNAEQFDLRIECWVIAFSPSPNERVVVAMFAPPFVAPVGGAQSPIFMAAILIASGLLSVFVARIVTRPLRRLAAAAAAFNVSSDPPLTPVRGPTEVKAALSTFNIMQGRVKEALASRTQVLAAVSHDLQTPLTRIRLRLEQVNDSELRERLIADVQTMQALVQEGLELARSHESEEPWSVVDVDSLVESLAEDAAEFGADVRFIGGCGASARVRPGALTRALNNLIDNAIKYGGSAEVSCEVGGDGILVRVRDRGPGLPDPGDPRLFEPFYRGECTDAGKAKGTGVGLTIARAQAHLSGGSIELRNHPDGGLVAELRLRH